MRASRLLTLALLLGVAAATPGAAQHSRQDLNKANRMHQKGDRALRAGNLPAAEEHFREAIELVPAFPAAHVGLGMVAMSREDFGGALRHFELARDGYAQVGKLLVEFEAKRFANAQSEIQDLRDNIRQVETQNTNPQQAQFQISQLQNRIDVLEGIAPPDEARAGEAPGEIFFHIGNALFRLDRLPDAVAAWETCRERSPKFAMVHNNLALAYGRQGKLQEAMASLNKAEELGFPVNPQFRADLERALGDAAR